MRARIVGLILLVVGLWIGLELPDADQSASFLLHRSIITHGPLIPGLLFIVAAASRAIPVRWLALGVGIGFAVHLAFDLYPRSWQGYALISVPYFGWMPDWFSKAWIGISALLAAHMAARLTRTFFEVSLFVLGLAGSFIAVAPSENQLWLPAITTAGLGILALVLPRDSRARHRESLT